MEYKILNKIDYPLDLRKLKIAELKLLSEELRHKLIDVVSKTGGHLGAGLGVIELTIALHHIFDTPTDKLIWDVGHQSYPHKILTGRKDQIQTIRQKGGLYGFVKRNESKYDTFGTAHSSTSISAGLGIKIAKEIKKDTSKVICVIGDGALSAGMAYEALNNAGALNKQVIVILNDNDMSIDKPVGAMSSYLSKLMSSNSYSNIRWIIKKISNKFPKVFAKTLYKAEEFSKGIVSGGTLFEELGFFYLGPIDGHNLDHLIPVLKNINNNNFDKPIFLHVITKKGKGYKHAEEANDKFHGVNKFDVITGSPLSKSNSKSYSEIFGETLSQEAKKDNTIVAITAAMASGTGLNIFAQNHPKRFFDVGIAEQHAVTMSAGLATEGMKPFAAIYSTFLQRAYDQIIHDVAIQKLPVRFAIDRAGQVGADGATHAGSFDIAYLSCLPNFIVMAAGDEQELIKMIKTSILIDDRPSSFRFPRGSGVGLDIKKEFLPIEIGKGRVLQEGNSIALINFGARLGACQDCTNALNSKGYTISLIDARFAKPMDTKLLDDLLNNHEFILTIEEGSIGGFSSIVLDYIHNKRSKKNSSVVQNLIFPDKFIDHNTPENQYKEIGMDAKSIENKILSMIDPKEVDLKIIRNL
ncbi:MAG: 1-deoxy-D-xylulose-5-phosphate synthase [Alphaproteobacteria bacterium MarineAlpha5_Bin8]|nr:MAG: 1-deoxy-D-xylulose-5-phosphate synthase [Alphaproteobacteria bacterium MarineAlpha5_Bin7]PPR48410.1 MAG: 1-deoxy-D-xylulose-5-phosphate synthase [Alphaproteobacteria bacterium MarineAlpha5_Bin8]PPR54407.1 MAG: 1-deoxy-D-xylulose-5-phosphate synthase [Alphaproteobacteria bacterium MarineAlpha5_Bin6]|tara:strand:+ start:1902 stop:3815 length:1914 start_codon:yes stop_codon:yes gene_type:complete